VIRSLLLRGKEVKRVNIEILERPIEPPSATVKGS
jgi:hypothetical protein